VSHQNLGPRTRELILARTSGRSRAKAKGVRFGEPARTRKLPFCPPLFAQNICIEKAKQDQHSFFYAKLLSFA
jgi:hypothetical protein